MTMGLVTSPISKIYYCATKKTVDGPRPNMGLNEAATALNHCENRRNALKSKRVAYDATSNYGKLKIAKRRLTNWQASATRNLDLNMITKTSTYSIESPSSRSWWRERLCGIWSYFGRRLGSFNGQVSAVSGQGKRLQSGCWEKRENIIRDIIKRLGAKKETWSNTRKYFYTFNTYCANIRDTLPAALQTMHAMWQRGNQQYDWRHFSISGGQGGRTGMWTWLPSQPIRGGP